MGQTTHDLDTLPEDEDRPVRYETRHTGVGWTMYLGLGLIVFTLLLFLLALVMVGVGSPLGDR